MLAAIAQQPEQEIAPGTAGDGKEIAPGLPPDRDVALPAGYAAHRDPPDRRDRLGELEGRAGTPGQTLQEDRVARRGEEPKLLPALYIVLDPRCLSGGRNRAERRQQAEQPQTTTVCFIFIEDPCSRT